MRLNQLLKHLTYEHVQGSQSREITDICYHSGNVREGSLFVCLKGLHTDGHDYLQGALEAGAAAVVIAAENVVPLDNDALLYTEQFGVRISEIIDRWKVSIVIAADTRHALAELAAAFFDYPAAKLRMVGITGTKGKTTTAYLLSAILRESGHKTGMIGTLTGGTYLQRGVVFPAASGGCDGGEYPLFHAGGRTLGKFSGARGDGGVSGENAAPRNV